jgi:beta-lactamase regulating signal transducer with metallopeptidase domain
METISDTISRSLLTFLLNSLWQIPIAAAVASLACRFMRTGPASHRHVVWVAALVAAILLPLASVRMLEPTASPRFAVSLPSPDPAPAKSGLAHVLGPELRLPTQPPLALSAAPASATVSFAKTWAAILLGAYALFVLVRLARLVRAAMRTVRIRRAARDAAIPELLGRVSSRCLQAFGLTGVKLLFSAQVSGPVTAGRAIILPESQIIEAPEDMLTAAIGHEMAHIARRDFASNLLYELLQLPVGFHPAAWLIRGGIERTREMACDELVAHRLIDAAVYARSIVRIAAEMTALPHPGYTLGVFDGDILEERIRSLVERPAPNLKRARLLLAAGLSALALCAVVASSLALTADAQGSADNFMRQAGAAYHRSDYKDAAVQFEKAVRRDPANLKAKLFLADSLLCELQEYGPAADTRAIVAGARRQYLDVLARDAGNKHATQGMMALYTHTMQLAPAHEWALKEIQADPTDETAYYTAGFVDWVIAYPAYAGARQAAGMKPQDPGIIPDEGLRQSVRAQHMARIEEGLSMLQTALQIDPGYSEAMAYMSLLYRIEAGIADSEEQSAGLNAMARNWTMTARNPRRPNVDDAAREPSPPSPPPPPPGNYYLGPR